MKYLVLVSLLTALCGGLLAQTWRDKAEAAFIPDLPPKIHPADGTVYHVDPDPYAPLPPLEDRQFIIEETQHRDVLMAGSRFAAMDTIDLVMPMVWSPAPPPSGFGFHGVWVNEHPTWPAYGTGTSEGVQGADVRIWSGGLISPWIPHDQSFDYAEYTVEIPYKWFNGWEPNDHNNVLSTVTGDDEWDTITYTIKIHPPGEAPMVGWEYDWEAEVPGYESLVGSNNESKDGEDESDGCTGALGRSYAFIPVLFMLAVIALWAVICRVLGDSHEPDTLRVREGSTKTQTQTKGEASRQRLNGKGS